MSKKVETKKANDPVGKYLVERIKELEKENEMLNKNCLEKTVIINKLEEQVDKFKEVKKLLKLSGGCICLFNTHGEYESVLASTIGSFGQYLAKLLELGENE